MSFLKNLNDAGAELPVRKYSDLEINKTYKVTGSRRVKDNEHIIIELDESFLLFIKPSVVKLLSRARDYEKFEESIDNDLYIYRPEGVYGFNFVDNSMILNIPELATEEIGSKPKPSKTKPSNVKTEPSNVKTKPYSLKKPGSVSMKRRLEMMTDKGAEESLLRKHSSAGNSEIDVGSEDEDVISQKRHQFE